MKRHNVIASAIALLFGACCPFDIPRKISNGIVYPINTHPWLRLTDGRLNIIQKGLERSPFLENQYATPAIISVFRIVRIGASGDNRLPFDIQQSSFSAAGVAVSDKGAIPASLCSSVCENGVNLDGFQSTPQAYTATPFPSLGIIWSWSYNFPQSKNILSIGAVFGNGFFRHNEVHSFLFSDAGSSAATDCPLAIMPAKQSDFNPIPCPT